MKDLNNNKEILTVHGEDNGTAIQEIMTKAVQDCDFKALLVNDPDEALKGYNLSEMQQILIKSLDADDFEKLTPENMEEFFAADSAVYTPDMEAQIEIEEATEEDI